MDIHGFALRRNNSCSAADNEINCGQTWAPFHACCPQDSSCFDSNTGIANFICCPNSLNCTSIVVGTPACANSSWTLYDWDGYFCCDPSTDGFYVEGGVSVGCADANAAVPANYLALDPISTARDTTSSTTSTTTSTAHSTSTSTGAIAATSPAESAPETTNKGSHTNVGAIAGGVVGGVVGAIAILLALFFLIRRRKRQQLQQNQEKMQSPISVPEPPRDEYSGKIGMSELDASKRAPAELGSEEQVGSEHYELPG